MNEFITLLTDNPEFATAIAAIIVSTLSVILVFWGIWIQRSHNYMSVAPMPQIELSDYENMLSVSISNFGIGPLRISKFTAENSDGTVKPNIVALMPATSGNLHWDTFHESVEGYAVPAGGSMKLIKLSGDLESAEFVQFRDKVRGSLENIVLTLKSHDLYGREQ